MRAVLSVLCLVVAMGEQAPVRVAATKDGKGIEVVAVLPELAAAKLAAGKLKQDDSETWLQFHLVDGGKEGPAMLGAYERRGRELLFVPRFPLQPEKLYRARFTAPGAAAVVALVAFLARVAFLGGAVAASAVGSSPAVVGVASVGASSPVLGVSIRPPAVVDRRTVVRWERSARMRG